ncbi:MAG: SDR family oxidoreductase [Hyphomonadaceae bacterium]
MSLKGKTLFITGASRGIGLAIATRAARDGANIIVAAKTAKPHPKLPGTIYSAAEEIEAAGGQALPVIVDVREEESVRAAVEAGAQRFGGIDVCINNASAINLAGTLQVDMKRYDLMHQINGRGTYLTSRACLPHLLKAANPHILNLSPPLDLDPKWFGPHVAYSIAKYNMSLCALGMAEEFKGQVGVNALWPMTPIATSAVRFLRGDDGVRGSRTPDIMADAAHVILTKPAASFTGGFHIDELLLRAEGVSDFARYSVDAETPLLPDLFVGDSLLKKSPTQFASRHV